MRPLILDDQTKAAIAKMVAYAKANIQTMDDLLDRHNGQASIPGNMDGYTCLLPFGYKVVFTIEMQNPGKLYHLSMSVDAPDALPNPYVVQEIMKLIGFKNEMEDCHLQLEDIGPNHKAINIIEVHEPAKN